MPTSLEILLQPQPQATLRRSLDSRNEAGSTAYALEQRSIYIAQILLQTSCTKSDITGVEFMQPDSTSRNPHCEVLNISADVNEERGIASVWVLARVAPTSSSNPSSDAVTVLQWRRKKSGVWECFAQSGMRSIGGY